MPYYNVANKHGAKVQRGDTVTDFRGETATFVGVTRGPQPGKEAKVSVFYRGMREQEFYAGVFDLTVSDA